MTQQTIHWRLAVGLTVLLFVPLRLAAVPACPTPVTLRQPDGTTVTIRLLGNENRHWHEDAGGYTVMKDSAGWWAYAVTNAAGDLAPGKALAGRDTPEKLGLPQHLMSSKALPQRLSAPQRTSATSAVGSGNSNTNTPAPLAAKTGTMKNLVVLVKFTDTDSTYTAAQYTNLFNQINYTTDGAAGSVKDFYNEVSGNRLNVDSVIADWVMLTNGYAYYGSNSISGGDAHPQEMVQEALALLHARGFDFSQCDADNDGWVDGLTVIHAGRGEESTGNDSKYIWSHKWQLASNVTYNGKSMLYYHTEPEQRGFDSEYSTWGITRIGVICHETGHFLGLPDLYDTTYRSSGVGTFCLMAGGSWNGDSGTQPAHPSIYCKAQLGWVVPTVATFSGTYTVPRIEGSNKAFRINGNWPSTQYLLIENRQGYGFDAGLPGPNRGLLFWHIDETQYDNDNAARYMVDLEEAGGTQHLQNSSHVNGDDYDYYRNGNNTQFATTSTPNNLSYESIPLGVSITNVSATGPSMTFTMRGLSPDPELTLKDSTHYDTFDGNGDNTVDPGESIRLFVGWRNIGASTASNVSAILIAGSSNVSLIQATAAYSNIAPNETVTNLAPFIYKVAKYVPAGTILTFTNVINTGAWSFTGTISRVVGRKPNESNSIDSADVPRTIPDASTIYVTNIVALPYAMTIDDVNVSVRLDHSYDVDLVLTLKHPDGTQVILARERGSSGDNYGAGAGDTMVRTVFDDQAATAIASGSAPFTNSYRPEYPLSVLNNKPVNGAWQLKVQDMGPPDTGIVYSFGLTIQSHGTQWVAVICNAAPVASNQTVSASAGLATNLVLRGGDANNDALSFRTNSLPLHGTLSSFNTGSGAITYTATPNYTGPDSFTFVVNDGYTDSVPATVSIFVVADVTNHLTVVSAYGGASPGNLSTGFNSFVSEWITNSPLGGAATQYVCTGGTVAGNAYTQTSPTNVTLTLTNNATLTWNWQLQYLLTTTASGPGSVPAGGWRPAGSNVVLTATPDAHAHLTGWSGQTNGCEIAGTTLTVPMSQARAITALFAIDSKTLTVASAHGGTYPGNVTTNWGTWISELVTNSPVVSGATQFVCLGGTVAGNAYTQPSPTNVTLTLTNDATLTWNWQTLYLLTTTNSGPGAVTQGGWLAAGSNVVLTATPEANAYLSGWSGQTNGCNIAGNTLSVPMTQARAITALFAADSKTLTVASAHGGTYPGSVTTNWGTEICQWLTNAPIVGSATQYVCTGVTVAGNAYTQASPTNVTLTLTNNATLIWNWQTQFLLTATASGPGSVTEGGWLINDSNVVLTATPAANSHLTGWSGQTNGCNIDGNTISVPMTQARTITALFDVDRKSLTVISAHGGTYPGSVTTNWDTWISEWVTNSPVVNGATQYICTGGAVAGNLYTPVDATNITLTLTNNATLTWNWQTQYLLTTQTNGAGRVTPGGWRIAGSNVVLTATPGTNRHLAGWSGDTSGCAITGNVITVPMTQSRMITADFAIDQKTLTVVSARGGTNPGTQIADYDTPLSQYIVNSPVSGGAGTQYVCTAGVVASNAFSQVSPTNITLQLTNNATLTWNWQTQCRLTTVANGPGTVTPGGWYNSGGNAGLTATPAAHAHLLGWSGDTNGCVIAGNTITAPMTQARAITASFALNGETLTVVSDHGGALPGTTGADYGTVLDLRVTNSPVSSGTTQYVCTGAAVFGNTFTQVSPTHVTLTLTNNAALTWNWQTNYWLGIATSGNGTVSIASGWQNAGSSVVLTAVAGPGYHLAQWTGDTNGCMALFPTLTVPMTRPRTITAVFAAGATPVISGIITRSDTKAVMAGVTISFSGVAGTAISDNSGNYSMLVPFGWSGTATASYSSGGFAKPALTFKKIAKNQAKKNFVWSPDPVISGSVTRSDTKAGMAGVTITAVNSGRDTTTDSSGTYALTVPYNWTGELAPAVEGGGSFKPVAKAFRLLKKNQANVKFVFSPYAASVANQSVPNNRTTTITKAPLPPYGFAQWAHDHGLVGNAAELFDQDADGDGISNGAEYAFGANLTEREPLLRLLTFNGLLTAEVPRQDPATLLDARELVEYATDQETGFWFPAVCLPPQAPAPATKQWFQAAHGEAVDFRIRVELEK